MVFGRIETNVLAILQHPLGRGGWSSPGAGDGASREELWAVHFKNPARVWLGEFLIFLKHKKEKLIVVSFLWMFHF